MSTTTTPRRGRPTGGSDSPSQAPSRRCCSDGKPAAPPIGAPPLEARRRSDGLASLLPASPVSGLATRLQGLVRPAWLADIAAGVAGLTCAVAGAAGALGRAPALRPPPPPPAGGGPLRPR